MNEASPPPGLWVKKLCVRRGERTLIADLDVTLGFPGLLTIRGPNGAGKSTLLLTLAGIIRPETGEIVYRPRPGDINGTAAAPAPDDQGPNAPARLADTHLLAHQSGIKPRLTLLENLRFWQKMHGSTGLTPEAALAQTGLAGLEDFNTFYLSAGQTRRLALARLLVTRRPIWLLDEPIAALDAEGEKLVTALMQGHLDGGGLLVVATHHDFALNLTGAAPQTLTLGAAP